MRQPTKDLIEGGWTRCTKEQWDEAIRAKPRQANADFERAKQIDPNYAYGYGVLDITHQSRNKHCALQEFEQAAILFSKQGNQDVPILVKEGLGGSDKH